MLDVHILTLPGLPEEWIKQRRDSIESAVAAAGFPVYVHEVEGIDGHLGKSRRKGYAEGTQPYVTHVDHDDWIPEDAFSSLKSYLDEGVTALSTGEWHVLEGSVISMPEVRHHLAVYKRSWLQRQPYDRFKFYPDQFLLEKAQPTHIKQCLYYHRIYNGSASRNQRTVPILYKEALEEAKIVRDPTLLYVELMTPEQIAKEYDDAFKP